MAKLKFKVEMIIEVKDIIKTSSAKTAEDILSTLTKTDTRLISWHFEHDTIRVVNSG